MSAVLESPSKVRWESKPLGDSCLVIAGQSPPGKSYNSEGDGLPFYQGKKEFTGRFIGPPTKWTTHVTKQAEEGDVLMSVRAPVGPVNFATESICIGRGLAAIRTGESVNKDFLFYGLLSKQSEISGSEGAVFASINKKQIEAIPFPVPPLPEQERIVAILDEAFERIATAAAHAERNLHNARELFQSVLQSTFEQKGEDWVETTVGEVCILLNGRAYKKRELLQDGKYRVLRVGNFFTNTSWYFSDLELSPEKYCDKGDLLYAWSASFGPRIWKGEKVIYHYHIWRVDFDSSEVLRDFLFYFFQWDVDKIKAEQGAGTTMIHVTKGSMEKRRFLAPPLEEQRAIVQKLDALAAETRRLETFYQRKLDALAELTQSLLQRAFAGEL